MSDPAPQDSELPIISTDVKSNDDIPPCLALVVPAYNECATIEEVLRTVLAQRPVREVIVVNDASTDDTRAILEKIAPADPRIHLLHQETNQGKGAAIALGLKHATSPVVMIQDADLEYDPTEFHLLLRPILMGRADVVYGSRFLGVGSHRVLYYWHSLGNRILTMLSNMATNLNLTDMETCYKAFKREVVEQLIIEEKRFGMEPEITAKISRMKLRIFEVAISYYGRTYAEGKKINWKDGVSALRCILKYNF